MYYIFVCDTFIDLYIHEYHVIFIGLVLMGNEFNVILYNDILTIEID